MSEYIERGALDSKAVYMHGFGKNKYVPLKAIQQASAADVVEVKHGWWVDKQTGAYGQWQSWCSVCGKHSGIGGVESSRHKPYCPKCGAKMDGGADNG